MGFASAAVMTSLWQRVCGNYRIAFYGRVVDATGKGVEGVTVTFEGLYSNTPVVPAAFVDVEKKWHKTVKTDHNGDFDLRGAYAYNVRIATVRHGGKPMGLSGISLPRAQDPAGGVSLNDRSSPLLPDSPEDRLVYRLVTLD